MSPILVFVLCIFVLDCFVHAFLLLGKVYIFNTTFFVVVQLLSHVWPHGLQHARLPCPSPSHGACSNSCQWWACSNSNSMMPSNHLILCHPLLLLPSSFPGGFSNESALHIWWPKYWSFSFSVSPSSEYSGLISFRTDWFDLLAVQEGTLKNLL